MLFSSWLRNRASNHPPRSRALHHSTPPRFRPQLEILEGRDVPSTLTVTNNFDSGAGSLRGDIAAAHSGDTINFAPNLNGQTIKLTSGELFVNKGLNIQGPGAGQLAISGGNTSRVFFVRSFEGNVTLSGLTITRGQAGTSLSPDLDGGGILNFSGSRSTLTIIDCVLSDNQAKYGGGIANEQGGSLQIVDSTLTRNGAQVGGGLYSSNPNFNYSRTGAVAIENCTLSDNSALEGGGIWTNRTTMTVNGCTLSDNIATYDNGIAGDDIYNNGGVGVTLTISDSAFGFISGNMPAIVGPWIDGGGNTFE